MKYVNSCSSSYSTFVPLLLSSLLDYHLSSFVQILQADLFKCLKEIHGESYQSFMLSKLVPVAGDVRKDDLDIEVDLAEEIAREVDIIVNLAANTTLDERFLLILLLKLLVLLQFTLKGLIKITGMMLLLTPTREGQGG